MLSFNHHRGTYPSDQQDPVIPPQSMPPRDLDPYAQREESSSASVQEPYAEIQGYFWVDIVVRMVCIVISWRKHSYMLVQGAEHSKQMSIEGKNKNERRIVGSTSDNIRNKRGGKGRNLPRHMAIRGSVAFQIRGIAIISRCRGVLDQDVEMSFAEKELVEQPLPASRALSHQIVCCLRDPGETRGLLTEWRPGLWNCQGTRLRGIGLVNLSMAAVGPERACPWL